MNTVTKRWLFVALMVLQTVMFGLGNVVTKVAYADITPLWCLVLRFGLAFAVFAVLFGRRIVLQLRAVRVAAWLPAALCMALSYVANNVALDLTTATNAGFLIALPVVFAPLLSSLVNRKRYPMAFLPFQAAVVVGLFFLCNNGGAFTFGPGEVVALLSSVALAGALVFGERGLAQLDVFAVAGTQIAVTLGASFGLALVFEPAVNVAEVTPQAWATIVFLALGCTCLAFFIQNKSLEVLKSSTVSLLLTGEPVFTAALSFPLLGEMLDGRGFAGTAIIVVAVVCSTVLENRKAGQLVPAERQSGSAELAQVVSAAAWRNRRAA